MPDRGGVRRPPRVADVGPSRPRTRARPSRGNLRASRADAKIARAAPRIPAARAVGIEGRGVPSIVPPPGGGGTSPRPPKLLELEVQDPVLRAPWCAPSIVFCLPRTPRRWQATPLLNLEVQQFSGLRRRGAGALGMVEGRPLPQEAAFEGRERALHDRRAEHGRAHAGPKGRSAPGLRRSQRTRLRVQKLVQWPTPLPPRVERPGHPGQIPRSFHVCRAPHLGGRRRGRRPQRHPRPAHRRAPVRSGRGERRPGQGPRAAP